MTVSTPSASELSKRPAQYKDAPADIKLIAEGIVETYASNADETDAALLEGVIASALCKVRFDERDAQAKRIEELESDCARKDELLAAAVADYNAAKALLSEAEKVLAAAIDWNVSPEATLDAIEAFLPKLREATK